MCQLRAWPSSNSYEFSYLLPFKKSLGTRKTSKMRLLIFEKAPLCSPVSFYFDFGDWHVKSSQDIQSSSDLKSISNKQNKGCKNSEILYVLISKQQYENIFNEKTAFRINLDVMFNKYIEFSNCFKI